MGDWNYYFEQDDCWEGYCGPCGDVCMESVEDEGDVFRCPVCGFQYIVTADSAKFVLPRYED